MKDSNLAPALPRNATTPWGFEHLAKNLAPCFCGGQPVQIEGGSPKTFRIYCTRAHNEGEGCTVETRECESLPESVYEWNKIQIAKGFDARKLHPLNQ